MKDRSIFGFIVFVAVFIIISYIFVVTITGTTEVMFTEDGFIKQSTNP